MTIRSLETMISNSSSLGIRLPCLHLAASFAKFSALQAPSGWLGEDCLASSMYYQARLGSKYGLQTMSWIHVVDGVIEFGFTELIHPT